jgi:ParB-like chromosome segregation protein Spo0J
MPAIRDFSRHSVLSGRGLGVAPAMTPSDCVTLRSLDDLRPNPKNARTHSKRKIKDLAKAIKAMGFIGVVVVDETGMILAGHARHAAAKLLGMKAIPTICVIGLSDELVRAFTLADNKFSERAGWNREILASSRNCRSFCRPLISISR